MSRISEKLRSTFSRLVLEWGISPRFLTNIPLSFKIVTVARERKASRVIKGQSYDLSEGGLGILSELIAADGLHAYFSNDMTTATQLEIELELPDQQKIALTGQTCRYQKLDTAPYAYLIGVKIVTISDENRKLLIKFLADLKREPQRRAPHY